MRMLAPCRTGFILGIAALVGACASRSPSDEELLRDLYIACTVELSVPEESPWRRVGANTFTFCVPPDFRPSGRRSWRSSTGTVIWAFDENPGRLFEARMPLSPMGSPLETWSATELIGGAEADLTLQGRERTYKTSVEWKSEKVHLVGSANNRGEAHRQLQIYRTVRFMPSVLDSKGGVERPSGARR